MRRFALLLVPAALAGCTTSAQDVVFESPSGEGEAVPLSVAWADMEARLNRLSADLIKTRAELDSLCDLPGASDRAVCARLTSVENAAAANRAEVDGLNPAIDLLASRVESTEAVLDPVSYNPRTGDWRLTGVNLHVRNTTGSTGGTSDGLGNIIVGWNEAGEDDARTGSHNLVVGANHDWEGHSGLLSGTDHLVAGAGAVALGGEGNTVTADGAAAVGGQDNVAAGLFSVALGGTDNVVEAELGLAAGGSGNDIDGLMSVTLGASNAHVQDDGWVHLGPLHGPELPRDYPEQ